VIFGAYNANLRCHNPASLLFFLLIWQERHLRDSLEVANMSRILSFS
jgi:hypothetical protein